MPKRKYISVRIRRKVVKQANGCCEYCQCREDFAPFTFSIEHIIPIVLGGSNEVKNLSYACQGCNSYKSVFIDAIDPITNKTAPLFNPRNHNWKEHFQWNKDYTKIIGQTLIGRATIDRLRLNRSGLVNLRYAVFLAGKHPPKHSID